MIELVKVLLTEAEKFEHSAYMNDMLYTSIWPIVKRDKIVFDDATLKRLSRCFLKQELGSEELDAMIRDNIGHPIYKYLCVA